MGQEIKCNVKSCKHNNHKHYCTLDDILVGSSASSEPHNKSETECVSFETQGE